MYKTIALLFIALTLAFPTLAQDTTPELTLPAPTPTLSTPPDTAPVVVPAPAQDASWVVAALLATVGILALGVLHSNQQLVKGLGQSVPYQYVLGYAYNKAKQTPQPWDEAILDEVAKATEVHVYQDEQGVWRVVTNQPAIPVTPQENK